MKKSKKVLSLVLALTLVFSAIGTVFAVSAASETTYTPAYTDKLTKEDVEDVLGDLDTILAQQVFTGAMLESIYAALPSMSSLLMVGSESAKSSAAAAYYKELNPARFNDEANGAVLPNGTEQEDGSVVFSAQTLTDFFTAHPIEIANQAEFMAEVDAMVDMIVQGNVVTTIGFALMMPMMNGDMKGHAKIVGVGAGIDKLCAVLGIEQENAFNAILGLDPFTASQNEAQLRTYLKNIFHGLLENPVDTVFGLLRALGDETKAANLYSGISSILNGVSTLIDALKSSLQGLLDVDAIKATIDDVVEMFNNIPTETNTAGDTMLDLDDALVYLVNDVALPALGLPLKVLGINGKSTDAILTIEPFNLANLAAAADSADTFMVLYNYLYQNLVGNTANKEGIQTVLGTVGGMLPAGVADTIVNLLDMSQEELFAELSYQTGVLSGRVEPTEAPTETTTGAAGGETTTAAGGETTTAAGDLGDNDNVDTGDAALAAVAFTGVAAAAAFVLLRKKK